MRSAFYIRRIPHLHLISRRLAKSLDPEYMEFAAGLMAHKTQPVITIDNKEYDSCGILSLSRKGFGLLAHLQGNMEAMPKHSLENLSGLILLESILNVPDSCKIIRRHIELEIAELESNKAAENFSMFMFNLTGQVTDLSKILSRQAGYRLNFLKQLEKFDCGVSSFLQNNDDKIRSIIAKPEIYDCYPVTIEERRACMDVAV